MKQSRSSNQSVAARAVRDALDADRAAAAATDEFAAEQYTHADAQLDVARQAQQQLVHELTEARARVERAKASYARARVDLDKLVARTISAEPTRVNWYDYPGALARREVADAAKVSPVQLQRLMERYRDKNGGPRRRPTQRERLGLPKPGAR